MSHPAAVITISNRALVDPDENRAAPIIVEGLTNRGHDVQSMSVIPNEAAALRAALQEAIDSGARVIITLGSTGFGPTDIAEDITRERIAFEFPGLLEEVRRRGAEHQPIALLSRGVAGVILDPQPILVVNSPGTRGGARDVIDVVADMIDYIIVHLDGGTCRPPMIRK